MLSKIKQMFQKNHSSKLDQKSDKDSKKSAGSSKKSAWKNPFKTTLSKILLLVFLLLLVGSTVYFGVSTYHLHAEREKFNEQMRTLSEVRVAYFEKYKIISEKQSEAEKLISEAEELLAQNPDAEQPETVEELRAEVDRIKKQLLKFESVLISEEGFRAALEKMPDNADEHFKNDLRAKIDAVRQSVESKRARLEAEKAAAEKAAAEAAARQRAATNSSRSSSGSSGGGGSPSVGGGGQTSYNVSAKSQALINSARKYIGPNAGMTCDVLLETAMADIGYPYVEMWATRKCDMQPHFGKRVNWGAYVDSVPLDQIQPGDILWRPGHVMIFIGNGQAIHGGWTCAGAVAIGPTGSYSNAYRLRD